MEQLLNEIRVSYLDPEINGCLASLDEAAQAGVEEIRYNQGEEVFLILSEDLAVPRLPIHHDMYIPSPEKEYILPLRDFVRRLSTQLPSAFHGLTYYFDPTLVLEPSFFRLYKVEGKVYLYLLKLDLSYRPFETDLIEAGTNDATPVYRTRHLYFKSEIIPLEGVEWQDGRASAFRIRQLISNTWIGETGRGYMERGIWMDNDLTKFFSKLVLADGVRTYPFYPFFCKYKTICASAPVLRQDYRRRVLPLLHRCIDFLGPEMPAIQNTLRGSDPLNRIEFSETLPLFKELRGRVPQAWKDLFRGYSSVPRLNERDLKEFSLEIPGL